ncbi:MAG: NYN domain-containing protein [Candidatus Omnitrophota bacterium]|jgi:predicted RNA-binding protein with PIN domain
MPIIIDGWNLIRSDASDINDDEGDSLESAAALISRLVQFQVKRKDPVILVFDSTNEFLGLDHKNHEQLSIVAARDADKYIKRYIDKTPERQRRNLRVVSSDKDIYYYARSSYATPVKSEEFWSKLKT